MADVSLEMAFAYEGVVRTDGFEIAGDATLSGSGLQGGSRTARFNVMGKRTGDC